MMKDLVQISAERIYERVLQVNILKNKNNFDILHIFFYHSVGTKQGKSAVMYMCARGIDFVSVSCIGRYIVADGVLFLSD
jgi:hypothetical protein